MFTVGADLISHKASGSILPSYCSLHCFTALELPQSDYFYTRILRNNKLTVKVVNLEEEADLVFRRLSSIPMDGRNELLQRDGATVVFVEDLEHTLGEQRLWIKTKWKPG